MSPRNMTETEALTVCQCRVKRQSAVEFVLTLSRLAAEQHDFRKAVIRRREDKTCKKRQRLTSVKG